ncbi:MAG: hypothetical protein CMA95_00030 [Euryarchaeota archaeon]|nr:hypothetical protein [Euryarchaeota archaeon]
MILNKDFIKKFITNNKSRPVPYRWTHGATDYDLGDGLIIYALIQFFRAKTCVCLGSGGGFIPRIMSQARKDLHEQKIFEGNNEWNWGDIGSTIIVDANNGIGGLTDWTEKNSFLRKNFYPRVIIDTTENAYYNFFVKEDIKIDYLHIDADHSYEGVKLDFELYSKILSPHGIISIHDTDKKYQDNYVVTDDIEKDYKLFDGPIKLLKEIGPEWEKFNLFNEGILKDKPSSTGLTLIKRA